MERQKRRVDIFGRKLQSKLFIIAVMEQVARSAIENDKKDNVLKINITILTAKIKSWGKQIDKKRNGFS